MKEERLAVLRMLEQGNINAAEAERLLALLQDGKRKKEKKAEEDFDFEDSINRFGRKMGKFARQVGSKVEDVAEEMEPKIKKAAQTVSDKTQEVAKDMKTAFEERKAERETTAYKTYDEEVTDADFDQTVDIIDLTQAEEKKKSGCEDGGCCCGKDEDNMI